MQVILKAEHRQIRVQLVGMARALKSGVTERLARTASAVDSEQSFNASTEHVLGAYRLLTQQLVTNVDVMRGLLANTAQHWKI